MRKSTFRFTLDLKRPSVFPTRRVVNGDTSNVFEITIADNGTPITLSASLDKVIAVFRRADGQTALQNVTVVEGAHSVTIDVSSASYRTGVNTIELVIQSRENASAEYTGQLTTMQAQFTARAATLTADTPNAPSQLPELTQLIADTNTAITGCNTAAGGANSAALAARMAAQSAQRAIASIPFIITAEDPYWNNGSFQADGDCSGEDYVNAVNTGRPIIVRVADSDDSVMNTLYQIAQDIGTNDVYCENFVMRCMIICTANDVQVQGEIKH